MVVFRSPTYHTQLEKQHRHERHASFLKHAQYEIENVGVETETGQFQSEQQDLTK